MSAVSPIIEAVRRGRIAGSVAGLFFDYDGTLSEIVDSPEMAVLVDGARGCLEKMAARGDLVAGVISGRALKDLKERVGVTGIVYSGNHGAELEIMGAQEVSPVQRKAKEELGIILAALKSLEEGIEGLLVEDKGLSVSVHTRMVEPVLAGEVGALILEKASKLGNISVREGKKVFEILPGKSPTKGDAMKSIMGSVKEKLGHDLFPVYFGDDFTDKFVYDFIREIGKGVSVFVSGKDRLKIDADYTLSGPSQVVRFMEEFLAKEL